MQPGLTVAKSMVTNTFSFFFFKDLLNLVIIQIPRFFWFFYIYIIFFFPSGRLDQGSLSLSSSPLLPRFTQTPTPPPRLKWLKDIFHLDTFPNLWLCLTTYREYFLLFTLNTCVCFDFWLCVCVFFFFAVNTQQFELMRSGTSTKLSLMTSTLSIKSCMRRFMQQWKNLMRWIAWCAACLKTCPVRRSVTVLFLD